MLGILVFTAPFDFFRVLPNKAGIVLFQKISIPTLNRITSQAFQGGMGVLEGQKL